MPTLSEGLKLGAAVLASIVLLLLFRRRSQRLERHLASKVVAATADEMGRFALRFRTREACRFVIYLRYEIQNRGIEDDYGIRCLVEAQAGSRPKLARDLGIIGPLQNPAPLEYEERVMVTFDGSMVTGGIGYRHTGRVELGEIKSIAADTELVITGVVTSNELTRVDAIEVYLVPLESRL